MALGLLPLFGHTSREIRVFDLVFGSFYLILGAWDRAVYKRTLSASSKPMDALGAVTTEELTPGGQALTPPQSSVTETTTRQLPG